MSGNGACRKVALGGFELTLDLPDPVMISAFRNLFRRERPLVNIPLPGFDPAYYLSQYPDVREAGIDPLHHYLRHGWKEGRDPSTGFSTNNYLAANPDVVASGLNPLVHFVNHGLAEGRKGFSKDPKSPATKPC